MPEEALNNGQRAARRVLITGAYRGIGFAIAQAFAAAGDDLIMLDRDRRIEYAARLVRDGSSVNVTSLCCDIRDPERLMKLLADFRCVDVLVHNAGIQPITPMSDQSDKIDESIRDVIDVNIIGTFNVIRKCLALIPDRGCILLTASIWGKIGASGYTAYSASKHAVIGVARSLAAELGSRGITVNAICPGYVETPGVIEELNGEANYFGTTPGALIKEAVQQQAIKTLLKVEDVAALYVFLASAPGRSITGQALTVDLGGVTI